MAASEQDLAKAKLIEDALRAFKPGAFSDRDKLAITHPYIVHRAHYLVERTANDWRMTVSIGAGERVSYFASLGEVNRIRQQLSDLGVVGLIRESA